MQFGYVPPRHAIAENLLINPRGKINQANEPDGVIAAGDYFCDGWKAGPAGCEVYIEPDGFRLVSGSILQLIPNTLESDRLIRTNLDVISGSPVIKVNGVADKNAAGVGEYIEIEISGLNSKFSRILAADSQVKPVYQQSSDELFPCLPFYFKYSGRFHTYISEYSGNTVHNVFIREFHKVPALSFSGINGAVGVTSNIRGIQLVKSDTAIFVDNLTLDARP
ncbi:hypothetical protein FKQ62_01390 [Vibrio sp. B1-2]|uniref:hypothetical protein n=1 Tax=Vibrio sp. B1-2 TaxID=2591465 RepID=UPI001482643B|nr:hypothetical protein [Vibrio sp. B1-2]NNN98135.1 hypothetical protein [Vibrio sp. B1-2]